MKRNTTGIGHDGRSNAFAKPGEPGLAAHHSSMAARTGDVGIVHPGLKPPASKRLADTPIHSGMHSRQIAGAGVGGMGHGSAVVSGGEVVGTNAAAVPPVPAHRRGFNSPAVPYVPITSAYGTGAPKVRDGAPAHSGTRSRNRDAVGGGAIVQGVSVNHARAVRPDLPALGRAILDEAKR